MKYLATLALISLFSLVTSILAANTDAPLTPDGQQTNDVVNKLGLQPRSIPEVKPRAKEGSADGPQMSA